MSQTAQAITRPPTEVVRETPVSQAPNGICYAVSGDMSIPGADVERMCPAVPKPVAPPPNRKASAFFSDAISIYLLSLFLDVDYQDLRERDYSLLAPAPMAERLRKIAELFPPNPGFDFAVYYRRRS